MINVNPKVIHKQLSRTRILTLDNPVSWLQVAIWKLKRIHKKHDKHSPSVSVLSKASAIFFSEISNGGTLKLTNQNHVNNDKIVIMLRTFFHCIFIKLFSNTSIKDFFTHSLCF